MTDRRSPFDREVDRLARELERELAELERVAQGDKWPEPANDPDDEPTEPWARRNP